MASPGLLRLHQGLLMTALFIIVIFTDSVLGRRAMSRIVSNQAQNITSPGYPSYTTRSEGVVWSLVSPNGHTISVQLHDLNISASEDCQDAYLKLYDGPDEESEPVYTWCDASLDSEPRQVDSYSSSILLVYKPGDLPHRGFSLQYRAHTSVAQQCTKTVKQLTASPNDDYISSPGYPKYYPAQSDCRWLIKSGNQGQVHMRVVDSRMEESPDCSKDYVIVYDGEVEKSGRELGRWCGIQEPEYSSTRRALLVYFRADGDVSERGFRIEYRADAVRGSTSGESKTLQIVVAGVCCGLLLVIGVAVFITFLARYQEKKRAEAEQRARQDTLLQEGGGGIPHCKEYTDLDKFGPDLVDGEGGDNSHRRGGSKRSHRGNGGKSPSSETVPAVNNSLSSDGLPPKV